MAKVEELVAELVQSGEALTRSLTVHSPHFLEHLDRRRRALGELSQCDLPVALRDHLIQALEQGQAAQELLRRERDKIESELGALSQKKAYFRNLNTARQQAGSLDIKA